MKLIKSLIAASVAVSCSALALGARYEDRSGNLVADVPTKASGPNHRH